VPTDIKMLPKYKRTAMLEARQRQMLSNGGEIVTRIEGRERNDDGNDDERHIGDGKGDNNYNNNEQKEAKRIEQVTTTEAIGHFTAS
jgi:hypothetical protein